MSPFLSYYMCHNTENHSLNLFYTHEASVLFHCVDKFAVVAETSTWYLREKLTQISSEFFVVVIEVDGFSQCLKVNSRIVLFKQAVTTTLESSHTHYTYRLPISFDIIPLTQELNPSKQRCLPEFLLGILNFIAYS